MRSACAAPLRQIVSNAGQAPDILVERVRRLKGNMGYDARTEQFKDMIESGIIDPAKVVKSAVKHAASVACNLLSIGASITFDDRKEAVSDAESSSLLFG